MECRDQCGEKKKKSPQFNLSIQEAETGRSPQALDQPRTQQDPVLKANQINSFSLIETRDQRLHKLTNPKHKMMKITSQLIILKLSEETEEKNLENVQKMAAYKGMKNGSRFFFSSKEQGNSKASGSARTAVQTCGASQNIIVKMLSYNLIWIYLRQGLAVRPSWP